MAIPKSFFNLIVYLYPTEEAANNGGRGGGTGFIVGVELDEKTYLYVVTNAHLLEGIESEGNVGPVIRFNTLSGGIDIVKTSLKQWRKHPAGDDLAVFPLEPSSVWRYNFITEKSFLRPEFINGRYTSPEEGLHEYLIEETAEYKKYVELTRIGVGDETITIGRYSKHAGTASNLPVARFGHISMLPFEPVHQPDRKFNQESFLVETHSISGLSGSPVFTQSGIRERTDQILGGNMFHNKEKTYLIGVDWGHFDFQGELIMGMGSQGVKIPSGMMCVVPAWKLRELLHINELDAQRKELNKQIEVKVKDSATTDSELTKAEFDSIVEEIANRSQ
jgi:hypothetical protein